MASGIDTCGCPPTRTLGGVHHVCITYSDLARSLAVPVLNQLGATLSEFLPVTDVAQVESSAAAARQVPLASEIQKYFARGNQTRQRPR